VADPTELPSTRVVLARVGEAVGANGEAAPGVPPLAHHRPYAHLPHRHPTEITERLKLIVILSLCRWSRVHLQSLAPTNPHWARVLDYSPFSLCVIHKACAQQWGR
jgi:hypothetical protein